MPSLQRLLVEPKNLQLVDGQPELKGQQVLRKQEVDVRDKKKKDGVTPEGPPLGL